MNTFPPSPEASKMLAAALEQMDGIIASTKNGSDTICHIPQKSSKQFNIPIIIEELRTAIENIPPVSNKHKVLDQIQTETRSFLLDWLHDSCESQTNGFSTQYEELQEKICRLERDKETLTLQVSVLNEQIDAQNEKIRDAEVMIEEKRERADRTEELLQMEIALRSSLENNKLELMAEITNLKLRVSDLETDKKELQEKLKKSEINMKDSPNAWMTPTDQDDVFANSLPGRRSKTPTLDSMNELEKMKRALESVMAANDEKDRKIEELRSTMMRYKRMQERMIQNKKDETDSFDPNTWNFSSSPSDSSKISLSKEKWIEKPPPAPRPIASSTPIQSKQEPYAYDQLSLQSNSGRKSISPTPRKLYEASGSVQSSQESISRPPKTPPSRSRAAVEHYGTVPRNYAPLLQAETSQTLPASTSTPSRPKTSFGKGFLKFKSGSRSSSAPNLAHTEIIPLPSQEKSEVNTDHSKQKNKGIKKIFGKLKRSNSQTMESDILPGDFQRGGMRATAGPRLGWSRNLKGDKESTIYPVEAVSAIDVPFARWDTDEIVAWLHELGLNNYIGECRRWIRNGDQLLKASAADLEKELGMKNPLHRKKFTLALQNIGSNEHNELSALDHYWVLRWLDDVGLPQYKDTFHDARIDGRMLHYLTVEDLTHLKITSLLHVTSLRRGIEILRLNKFDGNCLRRRSTPQEKNPPLISEVALWTNHRVMEWLRSVDLSEYAPNLRGSGVHGALMVLEPKFTAELLATLLSIPPNKTLLRRHLNTHFKELVGPYVMQQKRENETKASYSPLMPNLKIKIMKKNQFSIMKKRNKSEMDLDDYVCPFDDNSAKLMSDVIIENKQPSSVFTGCQEEMSQANPSREHKEKDKKAVQEIGAVSKEINSLTDMLQNERLFASMATSNV